MNPIINPLFFYFISVTDILRFLLLIGGYGVVVICVFVSDIIPDDCIPNPKQAQYFIKNNNRQDKILYNRQL